MGNTLLEQFLWILTPNASFKALDILTAMQKCWRLLTAIITTKPSSAKNKYKLVPYNTQTLAFYDCI